MAITQLRGGAADEKFYAVGPVRAPDQLVGGEVPHLVHRHPGRTHLLVRQPPLARAGAVEDAHQPLGKVDVGGLGAKAGREPATGALRRVVEPGKAGSDGQVGGVAEGRFREQVHGY